MARFQPSPEQSRVLRALWPYMWPQDRPDLKRTVLLSLVLILIAKLVTVTVPYTLKWATDALVASTGGTVPPAEAVSWLVGAPVLAAIVYGLSRILMTLLVQMREGMFAKVAMHAVRKLALSTFEHMHRLSLRFHLEKKTGGLTRILERGRSGIENISRMALMTLIPTIVEFILIIGVCAIEFDWRYIVTIVGMIVVYLWFTIKATDWRVAIRRTMNDSDTDANTKAVDSLLNFETVKYFGAEEREASRYDKSMETYEKASVKTYTSLAVLNSGQAVVFTIALTICLVMAAQDVAAGRQTVGHFAMVNLLMLQLFMPLNFMGMVSRDFKQG
ncbi:MAG: ABC transporter transmembrane domain-containing protein, partial [Hyphomicrobium sp.]